MENYPLYHNQAAKRYEFRVGRDICLVEYIQNSGGELCLTHTEVPENLKGRGLASALVKAVLEDAKGRGVKVVPLCAFVLTYIRRHPQWKALVGEGFAE